MIEILIALPACVNWMGNLCLLNALTRITGAMFTVNNENDRKKLESLMKPILQSSLVIYKYTYTCTYQWIHWYVILYIYCTFWHLHISEFTEM